MGQRTANKPDLYLVEKQIVTKYRCSRSPRKSGDHEQGDSALFCISMNYKKLVFAVRISVRGINPSEAIKSRTHTFSGDSCHPERQRRIWWTLSILDPGFPHQILHFVPLDKAE